MNELKILIIIRTSTIFYNLLIFSILRCSSTSSISKFSHVLVINHIWRYNILKYFYILVTCPRTHCKVLFFSNIWRILVFLILKILCWCWWPFFMFAKWWKFTTKKQLVTSLIFSFKISYIYIYNNFEGDFKVFK
jgi:hypothetical protein